MKLIRNALFLLIMILPLSELSAQTLKYSDIGNEKLKGRFSEYISKDGAIFTVGETITIGKGTGENGDFVHLEHTGTRLPASFSGYKLTIESIFCYGNKNVGWKAKIMTNKLTRLGAPVFFYPEDIVNTGELVGYGMSSDDALQELKRCKDKLDLELITKEEYDRKKAELVKFIK